MTIIVLCKWNVNRGCCYRLLVQSEPEVRTILNTLTHKHNQMISNRSAQRFEIRRRNKLWQRNSETYVLRRTKTRNTFDRMRNLACNAMCDARNELIFFEYVPNLITASSRSLSAIGILLFGYFCLRYSSARVCVSNSKLKHVQTRRELCLWFIIAPNPKWNSLDSVFIASLTDVVIIKYTRIMLCEREKM